MLRNTAFAHLRTQSLIASVLFIVSACKDSSPPPAAAATGEPVQAAAAEVKKEPSEPQVDAAMLAAAQAAVDTAYKGTDREPPQQAKKPQPGKKVWIISPG
ncbi:MAG TPA: hypothetical protein VFN67_29570, partial [Polyangiales bacterium]|nr:hypothetical protein [Polyangiales bacterium]